MTLRQLAVVHGTFQPKNPSTLRPGMERWIGYTGPFLVSWRQEDDEPFPGQWVLSPRETDALDGYWIPEEDFVPTPEAP